MKKYLKITRRFRKACKNFARGCEIPFTQLFLQGLRNWFSSALVSQGVAKFILNFARLAKFLLLNFTRLVLLLGNSQACEYFAKGLQNCWMLDSFSDSLPCILDWFGKGFEALQNLDSSCNLASTCFSMDYKKFSLILGLF